MTFDPDLRRETPLGAQLKAAIRTLGAITVTDFMSRCLWDDRYGYYRTQQAIGAAGDFITAAEISQIFGELVGLWSAIVWKEVMSAPPAVTLAEYGPGRGTMMRDALRAARVVTGFHGATRVHLVEMSEALADTQRQRLADCGVPLSWGTNLAGFSPPAIIIANEFFDAWPVAQWTMTDTGWKERGVSLDAEGRLCFAALDGKPPPEALTATIGAAQPGTIIESQRPRPFVDAMRALARRGPVAALIIDYGYTAPAEGDTLQAVRGHRYESPLTSPGEADLSSHVNFFELAVMAHAAGLALDGPVTQTEFLGALGVVERASRLMSANPARAIEIETGVARLIAPNGMGTRFKVMGIRSAELPALPGFAAASQRTVDKR